MAQKNQSHQAVAAVGSLRMFLHGPICREKGTEMSINFHTAKGPHDYDRISRLLMDHFRPGNADGNWIYPIWEYSYTLYWTEQEALGRVGVWEDAREVVGATVIETNRYDIQLCTHPEYRHLKAEMLEYAESKLFGTDGEGGKFLNVFVHDFDAATADLLSNRGFVHNERLDRPMSEFRISGEVRVPALPKRFRFRNLRDHLDFEKMNRALHRGFNHAGEPKVEHLEGRKRMVSGPHFLPYLTTAVEAPDGNWVTYCGMWYDEKNRYGYVEPVATDPDYRRQGLGTATVLESIRKCGNLGAEVAYVWTDKPFYLSFGFRKIHAHLCFTRLY